MPACPWPTRGPLLAAPSRAAQACGGASLEAQLDYLLAGQHDVTSHPGARLAALSRGRRGAFLHPRDFGVRFLLIVSPLPVGWPGEVVPVGGGFMERIRAADVQAVGNPRAAGEPTGSRSSHVLVPAARQRDNGYVAACRAEEEQRDRGGHVCPDHVGRRFRATPARVASEQPRGLPRLAGTVAIPGRSLGNVWVELVFIMSSHFLAFRPASRNSLPVAAGPGPARRRRCAVFGLAPGLCQTGVTGIAPARSFLSCRP